MCIIITDKVAEIKDPLLQKGLQKFVASALSEETNAKGLEYAYTRKATQVLFPLLASYREEAEAFAQEALVKYPLLNAGHQQLEEKILYINLKYAHLLGL